MKRNYFIAAILAFCSFCYEFLLLKEISFVTDGHFFYYSWVIGFYIFSLGVGYYIAQNKTEIKLPRVELYLALLGGVSLVFIRFFDFITSWMFYDNLFTLTQDTGVHKLIEATELLSGLPQGLFFIFMSIVIGFLGILSGMEMPLLIRMDGEKNAHIYLGLSYLGSVASSLILIYTGLFYLSTEVLIALTATLNLLVLLWLKMDKKGLALFVTGLGLIWIMPFGAKKLEQWEAKLSYYHQGAPISLKRGLDILENSPEVEIIKTPYQRMDKVYLETYGQEDIHVYLDKHFQFSKITEQYYHEAMVHIPIVKTGLIPKKVLVLGGGDGLLLRELLKHPLIERIVHVELDQEFLKICQNDFDFKNMNKGSLSVTKKITRHFADAYKFLKDNQEQFDFILIDFPYPHNYDLAKLYSLEFFMMVKRAMSESSIMVMDLPIKSSTMLNQQDFDGVLKSINNSLYTTILAAGHDNTYYYQAAGEGFVMGYKGLNLSEGISYDPMLFSKLRPELLKFVSEDVFEFTPDYKLINSIFKPNFIMFQDYRLKF